LPSVLPSPAVLQLTHCSNWVIVRSRSSCKMLIQMRGTRMNMRWTKINKTIKVEHLYGIVY